jgi:hypothetical protein
MTDKPRQYTRRSREEWQALITQWQQSDLSAINFCKHHNIGTASFYKWRQRLADIDGDHHQTPHAASPSFIDISSLSTAADHSAWHIVLNLGSGLSLTLSRPHVSS